MTNTKEITQNQLNNLQEGLSNLLNKINPELKIGVFYGGLIKFDKMGKVKPDQSENQLVSNIIKSEYNIIQVNASPPVIWYDKGLDSKGNLKMYFAVVDDYVKFANDNNISVMFACGLGGTNPAYTPAWIQNGNYTPTELSNLLKTWFTTILNRYKGRVQYAIVSGEAILGMKDGQFIFDTRERTTPTPLKNIWLNMGWYKGKKYTFPKYLTEIFKVCTEVGGGYKLIYNENDNSMTKSKNGMATYNLILALRDEGFKVDGVGMQLHCTLKNGVLYEELNSTPFDFNSFEQMIELYNKANIDVYITEFDINILNPNPTESELNSQAYNYAKVLDTAIKSKGIKSFITFGTSDKISNHITNYVGHKTHPYLFDENYNPKPAFMELKKQIAKYL
jgi:endo-1,4-beta-xylanase